MAISSMQPSDFHWFSWYEFRMLPGCWGTQTSPEPTRSFSATRNRCLYKKMERSLLDRVYTICIFWYDCINCFTILRIEHPTMDQTSWLKTEEGIRGRIFESALAPKAYCHYRTFLHEFGKGRGFRSLRTPCIGAHRAKGRRSVKLSESKVGKITHV